MVSYTNGGILGINKRLARLGIFLEAYDNIGRYINKIWNTSFTFKAILLSYTTIRKARMISLFDNELIQAFFRLSDPVSVTLADAFHWEKGNNPG